MRSSALAAAVAGCLIGAAPVRVAADAPRPPVDRAPRVVRPQPEVPTYFEANRGQSAPQVDFLARCRGYVAFLTPGGATFATDAAAFRMRFVGAPSTSHARGLESAPGRSNYFVGNDSSKWVTDVPHFARVACDGVLPGVDVVWRGDGRSIAYDLSLAPGVDPATARLRFEGADAVALDARGDVVLTIAGGTATMSAPRAYQDLADGRRDVAAAFVVGADGEVSFRVGAHDPAKPLVIDPSFTVSTYLGSSDNDYGHAMAIDSSDRVIVAGYTQSASFPVTAGAFQTTKRDSGRQFGEAFVEKLNAAATALVFATYLGGDRDDLARGLALDATENICVTGYTTSSDFPLSSPYQTSGGGFLLKLSAAGDALKWSTYSTYPLARIRLDAAGDVYVHPSSVYSPAGKSHVMKFDSTASTLVYDVDLKVGAGAMQINDIAVDPSGVAWAVGSNSNTGQASSGAYQTNLAGGGDAWITQLGPTGLVLYKTYIGGTGNDLASAVELDRWGDVFVAGYTFSSDFPTRNAFQPTFGGSCDVWVARMDSTATSLVWSTYIGGANLEYASGTSEYDAGVAIDATGEVSVVGTTSGPGFPMLNAVQPTFTGSIDVVFAEFASDGALEQSSFLGGALNVFASGVAFDSQNRPVVAGLTNSSNLPTTSGAFQAGPQGAVDAFVTGFPKSNSTYTDVAPVVLPDATAGGAYSVQLAVGGGAAPFSWSPFNGPSPGGLSPASSGVLSGTPTTPGVVSFMARVVDAAGVSAARRFRLTVNPPLSVATTTLPAWTVGRAYSAPLALTGGTPPFSWSLKSGSLPPGAVVDPAGSVSAATLTVAGTYAFVVQVVDGAGASAEAPLTTTVNAVPQITTADIGDATELRRLTVQFTTSGGTTPFAWSVASGALPVDAPLNAASGLMDEIAGSPGTYQFVVRLTDAVGAVAEHAYAVVVNAQPLILADDVPWGARGRPYSFSTPLIGGTAPFVWSVTQGQPAPGVSLGAADGVFYGVPTQSGAFAFTCRFADANAASDDAAFDMLVADPVELSERRADASSTIDFKGANGAKTFLYLELLGGADLALTLTRLGKGDLPVGLTLYDASQNPVDLGASLTTGVRRLRVRRFHVPTTGRYFLVLEPGATFDGRVKLSVHAPPRARWAGRATLDESGAPVVASFSAPPGAKFSAHVAPARRSKARPTIASVTDADGAEILVPAELRESKTGATLAAKTPLVGGDCALTIAPREGLVGDVVWTVTLRLPRRFAFTLPNVPTEGPGK